jgi:hypothetical protein
MILLIAGDRPLSTGRGRAQLAAARKITQVAIMTIR